MSKETKVNRIDIDMDRECSECGEEGATESGLCLKCVVKRVDAAAHTPADKLAVMLIEQCSGLIGDNAPQIYATLLDVEDNKLTVGLSAKLTIVSGRLYATSKLAFATKHQDETEGNVLIGEEDPDQIKLGIKEEE